MTKPRHDTLNTLEYYVLLALADRTRYGYAVKEMIEADSEAALTPAAGSLYRVLERMLARGLVRKADVHAPDHPHPGLERKYYALTPAGRMTLRAEASRLCEAAALAECRLGLVDPCRDDPSSTW